MANLDFSVSEWHGFGSVTQVCFGISVSNFMCMSLVAVSRSLTIVSYVAFKMAALWFWTMFNCNPPIAHCHPLLWGGGILVDHWSTISSCILFKISWGLIDNIGTGNGIVQTCINTLPEPVMTVHWYIIVSPGLSVLTHCVLVKPHGVSHLDSGNGLAPLPEPMMTYCQLEP